mgnify:CR=1 FL=1
MKKVVKFGGSSLASAEQFKKVGDIIRADEGRRYVVPSAPGKRNSADTKVTDMLYDCYRTAVAGRDFKKKLQNIKARYQEIIDGLNLSLDLSPEFEKNRRKLCRSSRRGLRRIPRRVPERYRDGKLSGIYVY